MIIGGINLGSVRQNLKRIKCLIDRKQTLARTNNVKYFLNSMQDESQILELLSVVNQTGSQYGFFLQEKIFRAFERTFGPLNLLSTEIQVLSGYMGWGLEPVYYQIFADVTDEDELGYDLRRISWVERLQLAEFFVFHKSKLNPLTQVDDEIISLTQWAYRRVIEVLQPNRIIVADQCQANIYEVEGLPELPQEYLGLNTMNNPPNYFSISAQELHDNDIPM